MTFDSIIAVAGPGEDSLGAPKHLLNLLLAWSQDVLECAPRTGHQ
jgi:hypothetical protein